MHGKGRTILEDGSMYEGSYRDHKKEGKGVFSWASGEKYEGEFVGGMPCGIGVKTFADGRRYEGRWRDNKYHGKGKFIERDGTVTVAEWHMGAKIWWLLIINFIFNKMADADA